MWTGARTGKTVQKRSLARLAACGCLAVAALLTGCQYLPIEGIRREPRRLVLPQPVLRAPLAPATAPLVRPAPEPSLEGLLPGDLGESRICPPSHGADGTLAVLSADAERDPQCVAFAALWEASCALGPRHTVVLGSIGRTPDGRFSCDGRSTPVSMGPDPSSVILFPGATPALPLERLRVKCGNAVLLFLEAHAVEADGTRAEAWLQSSLPHGDSALSVILFLDRPLWTDCPEVWKRLAAVLESSGGDVHVVSGATERFSWWQVGRLQYHTIGAAVTRDGPRLPAADGAFAGLAWITFGRPSTAIRVIDPSALLPAEVFAQRSQEERQALREACQAGAVQAAEGITEVRYANPTQKALTFDAEWHFAGTAGRVEPQMLGFTLAPGQSSRQRFHLQVDNDIPLKFAMPSLLLRTVCQDGLGRPVPVHLELVPHVRMGGEAGDLGEAFAVDGLLDDWPVGGLPLDHAAQVVLDKDPWRGPAEVSGTFYIGTSNERLCAALAVRRQAGTDIGCMLLLDPRGSDGADFDAVNRPVAITVAPDGRLDIDAPQPSAVTAVWQPTSEGGVLEVAFASRLFAEGSLPLTILADAVLTRYDASGTARTSLCFSGDQQGLQSSRLYGRFRRPVPQPPSPAGAASGQ